MDSDATALSIEERVARLEKAVTRLMDSAVPATEEISARELVALSLPGLRSIQSVYRQVDAQTIPYRKVRGRYYFIVADVMKALDRGKREDFVTAVLSRTRSWQPKSTALQRVEAILTQRRPRFGRFRHKASSAGGAT